MIPICVDVQALRDVMRPARNCVHAILLAWTSYFKWDVCFPRWTLNLISRTDHADLVAFRDVLVAELHPINAPTVGCVVVKDDVIVALAIDDLHVLRWTPYGVRLNRIPDGCQMYELS